MVNGVIFVVEHLVLTRETKMLGKLVLFGCMCGALCGGFGSLMGPPIIGNARYVNLR